MLSTLQDRIRQDNLRRTIDRVGSIAPQPSNPFARPDLQFDYGKVLPECWASSSPEESIILYKGALSGCERQGFLSLALNNGVWQHVVEVKEIIESGVQDDLHQLFDLHTSYYGYTALLSATFNPQEAQVFATTHPARQERKTIYQLTIPASRCVVDCFNTGKCGNNKELLILGAIFPEEITAVKIDNSDRQSELYDDERGIIRNFPPTDSTNRAVRNPANWRYR